MNLNPTPPRPHRVRRVLACALALGAALLLIVTLPSVHAAVNEAWVHRYSNTVSNANDRAVKVVRDAAAQAQCSATGSPLTPYRILP